MFHELRKFATISFQDKLAVVAVVAVSKDTGFLVNTKNFVCIDVVVVGIVVDVFVGEQLLQFWRKVTGHIGQSGCFILEILMKVVDGPVGRSRACKLVKSQSQWFMQLRKERW